MEKVLFVIYYDIKDFFVPIAKAFESYGYLIDVYPLYRYAYDVNDKLENYADHMIEYVEKSNPSMILWWFLDIPAHQMSYIKNSINDDIYTVAMNASDPLNYNNVLIEKLRDVDIIGTCCNTNINNYKNCCQVDNVLFLPLGYSVDRFHPLHTNDYDCDILTHFTNLFDPEHFPHQVVSRKLICDTLSNYAKTHKKVYHIYGPPYLGDMYPSNYKGELQYMKENEVYNRSRLIVSSRPSCVADTMICDDTVRIMATGPCLLMDKCPDSLNFFMHNTNCILYESANDLVQKIDELLTNSDTNNDKLVIIRKNAIEKASSHDWHSFVTKIHTIYSKSIFDHHFYAQMVKDDDSLEENMTKDMLWQHWVTHGRDRCIPIKGCNPPPNFQHEKYAKDCMPSAKDVDPIHSYAHWVMYGKKDKNIYISDRGMNNTTVDCHTLGGCLTSIHKCLALLNELDYTNDDKHKILGSLSSFQESHPGLDVTALMNMRIDIESQL